MEHKIRMRIKRKVHGERSINERKSCEHTAGHLQAVFTKKNCLVKGRSKIDWWWWWRWIMSFFERSHIRISAPLTMTCEDSWKNTNCSIKKRKMHSPLRKCLLIIWTKWLKYKTRIVSIDFLNRNHIYNINYCITVAVLHTIEWPF